MIYHALNDIAQRLHQAGLNWGSVAYDGSLEAREVKMFPVPANAPRLAELMVGIEWNFPPMPANGAKNGDAFVTITNPLTGEAVFQKPLEFETRSIRVHLYMKETREIEDRTGFSIGEKFLENESKLLQALGRRSNTKTIPVDGVNRSYNLEYRPTTFPNTDGIELHGMYPFSVLYPILPEDVSVPVFVAKQITLISGEPVLPVRDLTLLTPPIVLPSPTRVTTR